MKRRRHLTRGSTAVVLSMLLFGGAVGVALAAASHLSPSKVELDTTALVWSGQGSPVDQQCDTNADPGSGGFQNGGTADSYLLWIFSTDGGSISGDPTLTVNGNDYPDAHFTGGVWQIVTPGIATGDITEAHVTFAVAGTGNGSWILTISHGCNGSEDKQEHLTVTKTAVTSFDREHFWDISKKVETENDYTHEGYPKIWLYADGHGNEKATWTVDVTYNGYTDSAFNVSGEITIENDGDLDAVINGYEDLLAGTDITANLDCDFAIGDTLAVGDSVSCTYDEDVASKVEGKNVFTVTTDRNLDPGYSDDADIVWGAPNQPEKNQTIHVTDTMFGALGTVDAYDDDCVKDEVCETFTKDHTYTWAEYGATKCGDYRYDNTATITETSQSASATLKVNVQCLLSASAWAKGTGTGVIEARCFSADGFSNWGWTNKIGTTGHYTWTLWAGAAMCNTSKGFNAGTVSFDYSTTTGNLTNIVYSFNPGVTGSDTATYSGSAKYPKLGGKDTTAPGQYKLSSSKPTTWVIAHAKVQYPDPNFGP